jgi:hypothetical protein
MCPPRGRARRRSVLTRGATERGRQTPAAADGCRVHGRAASPRDMAPPVESPAPGPSPPPTPEGSAATPRRWRRVASSGVAAHAPLPEKKSTKRAARPLQSPRAAQRRTWPCSASTAGALGLQPRGAQQARRGSARTAPTRRTRADRAPPRRRARPRRRRNGRRCRPDRRRRRRPRARAPPGRRRSGASVPSRAGYGRSRDRFGAMTRRDGRSASASARHCPALLAELCSSSTAGPDPASSRSSVRHAVRHQSRGAPGRSGAVTARPPPPAIQRSRRPRRRVKRHPVLRAKATPIVTRWVATVAAAEGALTARVRARPLRPRATGAPAGAFRP